MAESKVNRSDINKFKLEVLLNRNIYQTKKRKPFFRGKGFDFLCHS